MKKLLSVVTAMSLAMTTMLTAITVSAAEKITADEVKEMIYSTGLGAHPELWDKGIDTLGEENDVLKPETRTVKDVIDVNNSYNTFCVKHRYKDGIKPCYDENGRYQAFGSEQDDDYQYDFYGCNKDGRRVNLLAFPENYYDKEEAGTVLYSGVSDIVRETEERVRFCEDYEAIAESINKSDIKDAADIRVMAMASCGSGIYVRDKSGNEYAIPAETYTDIHAQELGREVLTLTQGEVMEFKEWFDTVVVFEKNMNDNPVIKLEHYEEYGNGDEIRDTDTRAAYIGTDSEFFDVSGDLVSYVNELYDLGIVNGYDASDVNMSHINNHGSNYPEGKKFFLPEENITRAEAAAMITRMLRYEGKYSGGFGDISADDWFADDVAALMDTGLVNGYSDTEFAPYANIKYQEVMKILVYALGHGHNGMSYPQGTNETAVRLGLTDGLASFDTTAPITRGDMAIMLSNALDTHLFTEVGGGKNEEMDVYATTCEEDITLIDYLNGKKLNGKFPPTMD